MGKYFGTDGFRGEANSMVSAPFFTVTRVLSDFTLEVMDPAPMWLL